MLIDEVKTELRITHDKLDTEIARHIDACAADMKRVGVAIPDNTADIANTPLYVIAVCLWCKAQYDYQGKGDEFQNGYESLRDSLSLSNSYREAIDDV